MAVVRRASATKSPSVPLAGSGAVIILAGAHQGLPVRFLPGNLFLVFRLVGVGGKPHVRHEHINWLAQRAGEVVFQLSIAAVVRPSGRWRGSAPKQQPAM
jgi:hypothetical protein